MTFPRKTPLFVSVLACPPYIAGASFNRWFIPVWLDNSNLSRAGKNPDGTANAFDM
jgi:hypothetical protein